MEKSYLQNNPRREEITQSFSLRSLQPDQLIALKHSGSCEFELPEWAFDIYYPGHYKRTIKSVRITIPCVLGPYTNVSARLTMNQNKIRTKPLSGDDYLFAGPNSANTSISTSTANNDGGQFELNFNDPRYLPFEGGGAVGSKWTLDLPPFASFDYKTISDAIIHISYTALFDSTLKTNVNVKLIESINSVQGQPLQRLISLKEEFPDLLYQLQQSATGDPVTLKLEAHHFHYLVSAMGRTMTSADYYNSLDSKFEEVTSIDKPNWTIDLDNNMIQDDDLVVLVTFKIDALNLPTD